MATESRLRTKTGTVLGFISAEVDDLPLRAENWDDETEVNQLTFLLEWKELMDRLEGLDAVYRQGIMAPEQQIAYLELLRKLKASLPVIQRLRLHPPAVPLDQ